VPFTEQCLREWQAIDGHELYPDTVCLAGLYHSVYGTQGFQAFALPIEGRSKVSEIIGARGEKAAYYTCAMDRASYQDYVPQNRGLRRGETPVGHFSGRTNGLGWPGTGPERLTGRERWTLTAEEYTDLCAVTLSHVLKPVRIFHRDGMFEAMAEHLGGVALERYSAAVAGSDGTEGEKHFWANGAQSAEAQEALRTGGVTSSSTAGPAAATPRL
jgi:hypothetical protein